MFLEYLRCPHRLNGFGNLGLDMPLVSAGIGSLLNLGYWIALRGSVNVSLMFLIAQDQVLALNYLALRCACLFAGKDHCLSFWESQCSILKQILQSSLPSFGQDSEELS